jgi:SWI/SNF-related matrix-associated actin-dependent regulator 1 of chromatin subfamily A
MSDPIAQALVFLAGRDPDLARDLNGIGYNAFDGMFGHALADKVTAGIPLTEKERAASLNMLRKYRRQLDEAGITLPDKAEAIPLPRPSVKVQGGRVMVFFGGKPSDETRTALKMIPGWRWHPEINGTPWSVPLSALDAIKKLLGDGADYDLPEMIEVTPETPAQPQQIETQVTGNADVTLSVHEGSVLVHFGRGGNFQDNLAKVKALEERRWNPELPGKPWVVPGRLAMDMVSLFPQAAQTPEFKTLVQTQTELSNMSRKSSSDFDVPGLRLPLLPFQRAGVEFLEKSNHRAIIADEMGLGKTVQYLAPLQLHPELRPVLIIVPASLKLNTLREINKFLSTKDKVHLINGGKPYSLRGVDVAVINYDVLAKWQDALIAWGPALVIADEAHYAKNRKRQRAKALIEIAKKIDRVILATGTPVTNRPEELFPLLNMVDPKAWPNFYRYAVEYCGAYKDRFGFHTEGATNLGKLHEKIKPYVVRRIKSEVLKELPPKRRATLVMNFDDAQRAEYDSYIEEALSSVRQAEQLAWFEKAKQAAALGKIKDVIDWIENFLDTGKKLVVFATHHMIIDRLMDAFKDQAVRLDGRDSNDPIKDKKGNIIGPSPRQRAVDRFQNDDKVTLFVGNIKAAGVGLTLTAASDVAFVEFAWTPGDHVQAEDRCHRIGQHDSVTCWYLVASETVDEDIVTLLESKRQVIETIHDGTVGDQDFSMLGQLIEKYRETK